MTIVKKLGTIGVNVIYTIIVVAVLALALLFVGTKVDILGYEVKIVQSGSMEPAIMTGGIVVISPSSLYSVGDVVTYGRDTKNSIPVTHRIVEKMGEGRSATYITKGDANEDNDPKAVTSRELIGKVAFTIPYIGYVIQFARTPLGFATLIGIPALVIVLDELANVVWEVRVYLARKRKEQGRSTAAVKRTVAKRPEEPSAATTVTAKESELTPFLKFQKSRSEFDLKVEPYQRA